VETTAKYVQTDIHFKKKKKKITKTEIVLYLMIAPAVILYFIFHYVPLPGISLAFADFRVGGFKGWVGLDNFRYAFNLNFFWQSFINTWRFELLDYIFGFPAPIIFALLLNELRAQRFKKVVQTISTLPHFISWVVIGGIFISIFSPSTGYVNSIIKFFGGEPIYFLSKPRLFPFLFTFMRIWKGVGYGSIIYLAALSGIDPELYESAVLDGASRWKQTIYITLPGIKPTILLMFVLSFAGAMGGLFEPMYVLKNPMIAETAEVLDTYTYEVGLVKARYSLSTAIGLFKSTISLALILATNFLSKYLTEDGKSIL